MEKLYHKLHSTNKPQQPYMNVAAIIQKMEYKEKVR
jgi:hypothetical protein